MGGGGKDTLASVRTRAEGRGTTVYASVKLPRRNIEGVSASKTSKVARNTSQMFPLVRRTNSGVHTWLLNVHGMSVAIVLKR